MSTCYPSSIVCIDIMEVNKVYFCHNYSWCCCGTGGTGARHNIKCGYWYLLQEKEEKVSC